MGHDERLDQQEILVLKHKMRKKVCFGGSWCRSFDCYYDHVCPYPQCYYGSNCQFKFVHQVDGIVVSVVQEAPTVQGSVS